MVATDTEIKWLTETEGHKLFEEQTQNLLGISGSEFLRRYDAGEYDEIVDDPDRPEIMRLAAPSPFGR